ncbi:uncharacterized protein KIAA0825 homolog [Bombina bombina]|uniref:uncharacterized protein KIAA0825 homolog n=1 Tax=Bombina bombina TaxID=8345 RepID=UPI00235B14A1|nr:uncharacterized protein KIAA0825 homolog [Bombina bombina]
MESEVEVDYSCSDLLDSVLNMCPGDLEFQHILNDIDDKLKENSLGMEQCLQNLQLEMNESGVSQTLQNTTDYLQWVNCYHMIPSKPPEAPHCQVIEFLRTLQHYLKNTLNQEYIVLRFLLDLFNQCGIRFASSQNGSFLQCASQTSIHAIDDEPGVDIQTAWEDVRLHLRRFLVGNLQQNIDTCISESRIQMKTQYLQQFLFLYPESDVLMKYQNIQSNVLIDLLHKYSEMNADIIFRVYEDAMPKVFSVIKQDLFVLSRLVDVPLIVRFINDTFFETISEEMKQFFEIFCKANSANKADLPLKPSKNKHKERVQAFAAEDQSRKATDLYLHLDQLKSLSRFVKHFLWLEEKVGEAASEILHISCSMEIKGNIQGTLKSDGVEVKANETYVLDESSLLMKETPALKFGWRKNLKILSQSLLRSFTSETEAFITPVLQCEKEAYAYNGGCCISLVNPYKSNEHYGAVSEKEKPKKVAKFCFSIIEEFDVLFPLALACRENQLQEIRTCFVEAFCKMAASVQTIMEEWSSHVPSTAPLQNLFAILSTSVFVLQHFTFYNEKMCKEPLFLASVQRYQEFIRNIQLQVINYCVSVCATSIFQDSESHYWDDNKTFYEGERCSFSIQMWHYFFSGLRHDLWTILPPTIAQDILREVLEKTLALLSYRYAQVNPNYKRASQIRIDVMAILSCVENMLWSVCGTVQDIINPSARSKDLILKIHCHCKNLLTVLFVLTAPLKTLHETFKSGFREFSSDSSVTSLADQLDWLCFIKPSLFPSVVNFERTPSAGEMAVQGQLKLLLAQPCCNWNLLLETLLHSDCVIARTLLSCSSAEISDMDDTLALDCKDVDVTEAILTVLSYCSLSPKSFTSVLEKYMDQERLWDTLCIQAADAEVKFVPPVIRYLRRILVNSVTGTLKQITSVIHDIEPTEHFNIPENLLRALPEKWNFVPRDEKQKQSVKNKTQLTAYLVCTVISKLPSAIACLPSPVKYFYLISERNISETYNVQKNKGLLICNLISVVCHILEDGNTLEQMTGYALSRRSKELLTAVCQSLETIIGINNGHKEVLKRVLENIEEQRPKWIGSQMQKSRTLSMNCDFANQGESSVSQNQDTGPELTEQKINIMVLDICHKPGGNEYLRQIYHIIQLNEDYLNDALSCQSCCTESAHAKAFQLTLHSAEQSPSSFNPLNMFSLPNVDVLREASSEWSCDWSKISSYCLGMSLFTFRALLGHRWEAKDEESLSEDERSLLEQLKQL